MREVICGDCGNQILCVQFKPIDGTFKAPDGYCKDFVIVDNTLVRLSKSDVEYFARFIEDIWDQNPLPKSTIKWEMNSELEMFTVTSNPKKTERTPSFTTGRGGIKLWMKGLTSQEFFELCDVTLNGSAVHPNVLWDDIHK